MTIIETLTGFNTSRKKHVSRLREEFTAGKHQEWANLPPDAFAEEIQFQAVECALAEMDQAMAKPTWNNV